MTIITRFAPSPTGYLHIGSARTALFNFLFAKKNNGKFLLRIEDTDKSRSTPEATAAIIEGLKWLDIKWDDEIVYQSNLFERHKQVAEHLVNIGKAYYCYTSQEEINIKREIAKQKNESFKFISPWRDISAAEHPRNIAPVIRLKTPVIGNTIIEDLLQGDVVFANAIIDDMILLRSDQTPTYMLSVVVDDHDMGITHIIRGDDHLNNAAKQKIIFEAMGWEVPKFVHIPLIHGDDGAKLSKRHGALGVSEYKKMGFLPKALNNYLLRLGWSHGDDEIISRLQAIEWFDIKHLNKGPSRLDFAKIKNINTHYIVNAEDSMLIDLLINEHFQLKNLSVQSLNNIQSAIILIKSRAQTIIELSELAKIFIVDSPVKYETETIKFIKNLNKLVVDKLVKFIEQIIHFDHQNLNQNIKNYATENNFKMSEVFTPLRAFITGQLHSPSIVDIINILGKDIVIERIKYGATNYIS